MIKKILILLILCCVGCASTPPVVEYTIAEVAIKAARKANAMRFAPGQWTKAEQAYQEGRTHFRKKNYNAATRAFRDAYLYAEESENIAYQERLKLGEPP